MSEGLFNRVMEIEGIVNSALKSAHHNPNIPATQNWISINLGRQQGHTTWAISRMLADKSVYTISSSQARLHYPQEIRDQWLTGSVDDCRKRFIGKSAENLPSLLILDYGLSKPFQSERERDEIFRLIETLNAMKREPIPIVLLSFPSFW